MRRSNILAAAIAVGAFAAAPFALRGEPYLLHILILSGIYAIPAIGLNLMLGYTGLVSLGHAAFVGVGGYAAGILMVDAGLSFWTAWPLAIGVAGITGAVIGALCLRLRSHFFMIVTLAFGLVLYTIMNNWDDVTRGAAGFAGIPRPGPIAIGPAAIAFRTLPDFYWLVFAATLLAFLLQWLLVRSQFGRTLSAIRQDETLAAFKGIDTMLYKLAIFAMGSAIAGAGGALKVSFLRVAAPASFDMLESINLLLIVIVGGAGYLLGPILGALLFIGLPEYLRVASEYRLVVFGSLLVIVTLFARDGIAGLIDRLTRRHEP